MLPPPQQQHPEGIASATEDWAKFREAILLLVQLLLGWWTEVSASQLQVERISGAMTNAVFHLSLPRGSCDTGSTKDSIPQGLLLRVYGSADGQWMFEREQEERRALALTKAGLIPPWLGTFGNGRLEGWIESRPLKAVEFRAPEWSALIARRLRVVHDLQIEGLAGMDIWEKVALWSGKAAESFGRLCSRQEAELPKGWGRLLEKLRGLELIDSDHPDRPIARLRSRIATTASSPNVYIHCDVCLLDCFRTGLGTDWWMAAV